MIYHITVNCFKKLLYIYTDITKKKKANILYMITK